MITRQQVVVVYPIAIWLVRQVISTSTHIQLTTELLQEFGRSAIGKDHVTPGEHANSESKTTDGQLRTYFFLGRRIDDGLRYVKTVHA